MKKPKPHATAQQFEDALLDQIKHARLQNVSVNAISSAASFSILILTRLFPDRKGCPALVEEFSALRADAMAERRAAEQRQKQQEQDTARRIIIPQGRN